MEREGIKAFIKFAYEDPLSYNIIWESLFINREIFQDYYEQFAQRYILGLEAAKTDLEEIDLETLAYILMGIANFVGLQVIFKKNNKIKLSDKDFDFYTDQIMRLLRSGIFLDKNQK